MIIGSNYQPGDARWNKVNLLLFCFYYFIHKYIINRLKLLKQHLIQLMDGQKMQNIWYNL